MLEMYSTLTLEAANHSSTVKFRYEEQHFWD